MAAILEVGSVVMLILMTKDLKCDLKSINGQLKSKQNRAKMAKFFIKVITFHSEVKQLSGDF